MYKAVCLVITVMAVLGVAFKAAVWTQQSFAVLLFFGISIMTMGLATVLRSTNPTLLLVASGGLVVGTMLDSVSRLPRGVQLACFASIAIFGIVGILLEARAMKLRSTTTGDPDRL